MSKFPCKYLTTRQAQFLWLLAEENFIDYINKDADDHLETPAKFRLGTYMDTHR